MSQIEEIFAVTTVRQKLSSVNPRRIAHVLQNQDTTGTIIIKVSTTQNGAAMMLMSQAVFGRDIFTPESALWVEANAPVNLYYSQDCK